MKPTFFSFAAIALCSISAAGLQAATDKQHNPQPEQHNRQPAGNSTPGNSQQKKTKLYIIRVIDSASKSPVKKAQVTVELDNSAKTKWSGLTHANGFFEFKWVAVTPAVKAHTSIEAQGFTSLDSFDVLIEDRIISLTKLSPAKPANGTTQ